MSSGPRTPPPTPPGSWPRHSDDAAPLCLNDGSLAGTISSLDIVAQVVAKDRDPREVSLSEFAGPADVVALDLDVTLEDAVALMCRHHRSRLLVLDDDSGRRLRHPARHRPFHQLPGALDRQLTDADRADRQRRRRRPGEAQPFPTASAIVRARAAASSRVTTSRP